MFENLYFPSGARTAYPESYSFTPEWQKFKVRVKYDPCIILFYLLLYEISCNGVRQIHLLKAFLFEHT